MSTRTTHRLDVAELHVAIYAQSHREGLSSKEVAEQLGVSESTLTRIKQGKRPDADALVTLLVWLGRDAADFTVLNGGAR